MTRSKILKRYLAYLERRGRLLTITDPDSSEVTLLRYYVLFKDKVTPLAKSRPLPFNVYIHHFVGSDDLDLHDHPWGFLSFILSGGYWEISEKGKTWIKPGSLIIRKSNWRHRIEIDPSHPDCYTLLVRGMRVREWGYWVQGVFVTWRKHLQGKQEDKDT